MKILSKDNLALNIANALLEGKVDYVQDKLGPLLRSFVSVRDTATKAPHENYYHGFLNGIFTNCKDNLGEYHSNYESGDGYADITFNNLGGTKACVIEIKVCKEKESRAKKANEAIEFQCFTASSCLRATKHDTNIFLSNSSIRVTLLLIHIKTS